MQLKLSSECLSSLDLKQKAIFFQPFIKIALYSHINLMRITLKTFSVV